MATMEGSKRLADGARPGRTGALDSTLPGRRTPSHPSPTARPIPFTARRDVRAAIARLGRCEDVAFSPDGGRIAIAGLVTNRLLVLDVAAEPAADRPRIALTGFLELESPAFNQPHGIVWADDESLIVANRRGHVAIVALPQRRSGASCVEIAPLLVIGADGTDMVTTPGSVALRPAGLGLFELLVCNNYVDHVTRHLLDGRDGWRVLASEVLLGQGLSVPDGIAQSPCGQWIAVSNHECHNVLLFRNDDRLNAATRPDGVLAGLSYPHGLKFAADGRALLVADAGAPFVHIFRSEDRDWSGERAPSETIRVLRDATFRRGHHVPAEGGPKGIDLSRDGRVMVASCEEQPLAFFDLGGLLQPADPGPDDAAGEADRARGALARYLLAAQRRAQQESEAIRRAGRFEREALAARENEISAFMASRSWRLTAPLRRLRRLIQMMKRPR